MIAPQKSLLLVVDKNKLQVAETIESVSGIRNDPKDWAEEVGNPLHILGLLLSIINVSVHTVEIVKGLPRVEF